MPTSDAHPAPVAGESVSATPLDVRQMMALDAVLRLVQPDHLTPMGARIIRSAMDGGHR